MLLSSGTHTLMYTLARARTQTHTHAHNWSERCAATGAPLLVPSVWEQPRFVQTHIHQWQWLALRLPA